MERRKAHQELRPAEVSLLATSYASLVLAVRGEKARWSRSTIRFLEGTISMGGVRPQPLPPPPPSLLKDLARNLGVKPDAGASGRPAAPRPVTAPTARRPGRTQGRRRRAPAR